MQGQTEKISNIKIVTISLIKNEDMYIEKVIGNVVDFADEMIILDNMSTDNTYEIVKRLAEKHPKIRVERIQDFRTSGQSLYKYINTPTWILSVDGDELYDKDGLTEIRKELKSGKYSDKWAVSGRLISCVEVGDNDNSVKGYMSPPAKVLTKLYNFNAITKWKQKTERLHGGKPSFKKGYRMTRRHRLHDVFSWEDIPLRFLHLCFVKRSSKETAQRLNPLELLKKSRIGYKEKKYKTGELIEISTKGFFNE
jgi:glycosyltransferase involved in cell wall biosynthesis